MVLLGLSIKENAHNKTPTPLAMADYSWHWLGAWPCDKKGLGPHMVVLELSIEKGSEEKPRTIG